MDGRWYHGDISPDEVETLLKRKEDGSFLVRASYSNPGDYSLCVRIKEEIVNVKVCSRGKMFDLGGGKQFGNIEDLIEHYKEHPFKVTDGRQVYLLQGVECSTSRQTCSTDGAAISYYHRTIERFVIPLFSQLEYDDDQWPIPWENGYVVTLSTVDSPDNSKDDGMIAIHKSGGCYSLYLHGHDDIQSQFKLYKAVLHYSDQSSITLTCLESEFCPGYFLRWTSSKDIGFYVGKPGRPPRTKDEDARCICWNQVPAPPSSQRGVTGVNVVVGNPVSFRAWDSPLDITNISGNFLTFETQDTPNNVPVLTPEYSTASSVIVTT
ncbi:uncharacterized protein [Dysidea avara]|uniref:uncharacterized protein n=1 Tax=Dysidea avara TaxID=196820 RepID=UPI003324EB7C